MKKHLLTLAAGAAVLAAVPAAAQVSGNATYNDQNNMSDRIERLYQRLDTGVSEGTIDRTEARSLRRQLRQLSRLEARYSSDGLSAEERQDLRTRLRYTRDQFRIADGGNNRYAMDDDRYDRYDPDNRYAMDDDRHDRYDPKNRYAYSGGVASRYDEVNQVCVTQSGFAAIFSRFLGSDNCLRVGERVTFGMYDVPSNYRNDFRDGNTYYHGYLDGNVVQVDRRTGTVARIYDVQRGG